MSFMGVSFSVHREGFKFIAILAAISIILISFSTTFGWIGIVLTLFCAFFFRNPKRAVPSDENLIVSPCDGTVCAINFEAPPKELGIGEEKRYRVSIFLSIFNVHINRLPVSGNIKNIIYHPGSFLNASLDKASVFNERNTVIMEMNKDSNNLIAFTQIAGMIARRIVCDVHEGQEVSKGDVFGLIRFGSRCDVWLPVGSTPLVFKGQSMISGESIISDYSIKDAIPREGNII